jgi:hypothetical protein
MLPAATPSSAGAPVGRILFHLADPRIDEASGLAVATREPGVWFTHNDSGDSARFFAIGSSGRTLATYAVDGAHNVDWEDMAAARTASHVPALWFADTGDNQHTRTSVDIYAVPEPAVPPISRSTTVHVRAVRYRLRYPDGPHDAESLLVDPRTSRIYVATKSYDGTTTVYVAPARPSASGTNRLALLATLHWSGQHPVTSLADLAAQLATSGGAFSPDGRTLALRTYTDVYLFPVTGSGTAAVRRALAAKPRRLTLPKQPQGESVCFRADGKALFVGSERAGSAVLEVLIPKAAPASPAVASASATAAAAAASPQPSARVSAETPAVAGKQHSSSHVVPVAAAVVVGAAVVTYVVLRQRRGGRAPSSR